MTENEYIACVESVKAQLYRTAYLYLSSEALALDAVDEAVYQGLRAYPKLREERFFNTWMTRILMNVCNAELRRRKRELYLEELPETAAAKFDTLPLREAIGRLSKELRAVIILRYFTGLTLAETAESLGIPPGTVSTRQRRALDLLRMELCEEVQP